MPAGVRIFDGGGNLLLELNRRMFRKLGTVSYPNSNGAANFSRQAEDTVCVAVARGMFPPNFSINTGNNTISWDWSGVPSAVRYGGTVDIWAY